MKNGYSFDEVIPPKMTIVFGFLKGEGWMPSAFNHKEKVFNGKSTKNESYLLSSFSFSMGCEDATGIWEGSGIDTLLGAGSGTAIALPS